MKIGTKEYYIEQSKRCEEKSNKYLKLKDSNMAMFFYNACNGFKIKARQLKNK